MREAVNCLYRADTLIAYITTDLDHHVARRVREEIDHNMFLYRPSQLVLDFSSVGFMDSSALALILGRAEVARELGASVRLVGLSPLHKRLVRLGGLDRIEHISIATDDK